MTISVAILCVANMFIFTDQADDSNRVATSNLIPSVNFQVLLFYTSMHFYLLLLLTKCHNIAWLSGEKIYTCFLCDYRYFVLYGIRLISWFTGKGNTV